MVISTLYPIVMLFAGYYLDKKSNYITLRLINFIIFIRNSYQYENTEYFSKLTINN